MNKNILKYFTFTLVILVFTGCSAKTNENMSNREQVFNMGWKFTRDSLVGAERPEFENTNWLTVDLPHDYSMMDLPGEDGPDQIGPFLKNSPGGGRSNGHVLGGTAWYRNSFVLDKIDAGKTVVIKFDGVYMETEVWVNGKNVGIHKNGYTPFWFDITKQLNPAGESNVIAVKVDNTGQNSRWYSGSGIYRNVHLVVTDPVHVGIWGVTIRTPEVRESSADIDIAVTVQNDGDHERDTVVQIRVKDPAGVTVNQDEVHHGIEAGNNFLFDVEIPVANPSLWSPDSPNLYQAEITVMVDQIITDQYVQSFGIRSIEYSIEKGFLLNGESIELKGGCMHHDNGLLGAAAFDRAEERRVEIMKANGFNAIRCSHNPPSEAFLNACDRIGMLVIDEFTDVWEESKTPQDYSRFFKEWWRKDLTDMVRRDRNHPSIIMWSIGNEIREKNDTKGHRIAKQLIEAFKKLDTTRPLTAAVNRDWMKPLESWEETAVLFTMLDLAGYNYEWERMGNDHLKYPERIMFGSESMPNEAFDFWTPVEKYSWVIGDFVWTAMDYLGEAGIGNTQYVSKDDIMSPRFDTPSPETDQNAPGSSTEMGLISENTSQNGAESPPALVVADEAAAMASFSSTWPWFGANCGDIDITGEKKPQKAYRDVIWDISPLEINVHAPVPEGKKELISLWGWPDEWPSWSWKGNGGQSLQVRVFTKAPHVRLELNGKVVGEKELSLKDKYTAIFEVPYQPGELKAVTLENGQETASKILKTPGEPAAIKLIADRDEISADRNDLSFIKIEVVDQNGQLVPLDSVRVTLSLTGDGELVASGNGCPYDMGSVNRPVTNTFKGKAQAIVRPFSKKGTIILKAESEGLKPGEVRLKVN